MTKIVIWKLPTSCKWMYLAKFATSFRSLSLILVEMLQRCKSAQVPVYQISFNKFSVDPSCLPIDTIKPHICANSAAMLFFYPSQYSGLITNLTIYWDYESANMNKRWFGLFFHPKKCFAWWSWQGVWIFTNCFEDLSTTFCRVGEIIRFSSFFIFLFSCTQ